MSPPNRVDEIELKDGGSPTAIIGADAAAVSFWFDEMVEAKALDDTPAVGREAAEAYARMAMAENTRPTYRAVVRARCARYRARNVPPLPSICAGVAGFLASERGCGLTPETLKFPHRHPLPTPRRVMDSAPG